MRLLRRSAVALLCVALPVLAQEPEVEKKPVRIRSITLHEEGEPDRSIEIENAGQSGVPRDVATSSTIDISDLTGNWTLTEDSGGGMSNDAPHIRIRQSSDGSLVAEFPTETRCPAGSGQRTQYLQGKLDGNLLSGTIDRCSSAAFIEKCGNAGVYTTAFRADVRDADTIVGRYTATGYRIGSGGCVEDSNYDGDETFVLRRDDSQVASGASGLTEETAADPPQCRPLDLDRYCRDKYGNEFSSVLIDPKGAYDWRCTPGLQRNSPQLRDVNVVEACQAQHGPLAIPKTGNASDGYSWCCELPPNTPIRVYLRRINVYGNGDTVGRGNIELSFKVILGAKYCGGRSVRGYSNYFVCDEWNNTVRRKIDDNRSWAIRYTTPAIGVTADSALFIEWMAAEDDTLSGDDRCGRFTPQIQMAGEDRVFERPIIYLLGLAEDLEQGVFKYQTLETPVVFPTGAPHPEYREYPVDVSSQHFDPETGELGPVSVKYFKDERLYCQDARFAGTLFFGEQSLPWFFGGLHLSIDLMVFPDAVPRSLLFGTPGGVPDEPEPIDND